VTRKTPPTLPTSSPRTTTRSSRRISWRSASLMAWTMFICGIASVPLGALDGERFVALLHQIPGGPRVHVFEQGLEARPRRALGGRDGGPIAIAQPLLQLLFLPL